MIVITTIVMFIQNNLNQMYANQKKGIDRRIDCSKVQFIGALNIDRSLYLVEFKQIRSTSQIKAKRKLLAKSIALLDNNQHPLNQQSILRKLYSGSIYYFKPQSYDFQQNIMFIFQKIQPLSLQSIIWIHRKESISISKEFIRLFATRMYDGLTRLKSSQIVPQNLKPTNLFLEINDQDRNWLWGEPGLHTNRRNQFYWKLNLQTSSKVAIKVDPLELQFYSLGVMLLQMMTLQPVKDIYEIIQRRGEFSSIQNFEKAQEYYGKRLTTIIKFYLNPPKDNSFYKLIQQFKNQAPQDGEEEPKYERYWLTEQRLDNYFKANIIQKIQDQAKEHIKDQNYCCRDIFETIASLDPHFQFYFTGMAEFNQFLNYLGVKLQNDELLFVSTFYCSLSAIRYFKIIQKLFTAKQIIQNLIVKAVDNYDNFKDFFQAQTKGRDFWKADQIKLFLQSIQAPFEQKEVIATVVAWTGKSTSIKYDELYKIFKPIIGMSMSLSIFKKTKTQIKENQHHQGGLKELFEQLMVKQPNLIAFFRKHDLKQNWTVDYKIEKILKTYLKAKEQDLKRAFVEMWQKGSIPGDLTKVINYVYLLRNLQLYEHIQLMRMILTQKINEAGREEFIQHYKKHEKGWTYQSLVDFNLSQNLDFDERQLKSLFGQMDTDHSGVLEPRQLLYKLTGLKQFDYQAIVESIKFALQKQGINLFQVFQQMDPRARLVIGSSKQLGNIISSLGVQMSDDHLDILFNKFATGGKFQYLIFLRMFYPLNKLFLYASLFVLEQHYKDDFQKLFQIGLKEGRKKWNKQSLNLVSQQFVLGFREVQIGQVWESFDPHGEGSLTKEQVANIFNKQYEQREELTRKKLQSPKKRRKQEQDQADEKQKPKNISKSKEQNKKQDKVLQEFKKFKDSQIIDLGVKFLLKSEEKNGLIQIQTCIEILFEQGIRSKKSEIMQILTRFKQSQIRKKISINFVTLLFFMIDAIHASKDQKDAIQIKSGLCISLMKQIKKLKKISNQRIFQWCRKKDRMRLADFQEAFSKLIQVQVYSEDLSAVWQSWGDLQYMTLQDFDKLLQTKQYKPKTQKQKQQERQRQSKQVRKKKDLFEKFEKKKPSGYGRLGDDNKMADFVNESQEQGTPYLKNIHSFGEKQPSLKKQSSRNNSIRQKESDSRNEREGPTSGRFGGNVKDKYTKEQTSRFAGGDSKNKQLYPTKKGSRQQKIQLEEYTDLKKQKSKREQSKLKEKQREKSKMNLSKTTLLQKLKNQIDETSDEFINELFSKANLVDSKKFNNCLSIHYNFSEEQAAALVEHLGNFGKIKLQTLRNGLSKLNTERQTSKERGRNSKEKIDKNSRQKEKSPQKQRVYSPKKGGQKQGKRLIDPRRQKINVPLVKEHIRLILNSFGKKYQSHQLQGYYFGQFETISRQSFVGKTQSINNSFSGTICDRIFDYLKPDSQDKVNILSFKLGMGLEQPENTATQDYLPQQLEKQMKSAFQKADKDRSGYIESHQIECLLSSLGFNENIKQIQNYFAKMDQNYDNKISYPQFRYFIEDQILPQLNNFDEDEQQLQELLRNNDIFRHGALSSQTLQAVIDRFGVKLSQFDMQLLVRFLNPQDQEVNINDFLTAVRNPTIYQGKIKSILYKIRLRKKVQLREVQKIFENISSCFVLAYTPTVMENRILNISTPFSPILHESGLFYNDLPMKDIRKKDSQEGLIGGQINASDLLVQILLKQVNGVPIPQKNEIKSNITRRYVNITLFDLSSQTMKNAVWQVEAEWDPEIEDVWRFSNNIRSIFIKIGGYQPRKYQKYVLLYQFVIGVVDNNRTLEINCGCATIPVRELNVPEGKTTKKLKLITGLPNKAKQIDKAAISKRSGWKNFFGGQIDSELQIEIIHQNKFKQHHRVIAALPSQCIIARKSLNYLWVFRQFLADVSYDGTSINRLLPTDLRIITFQMTLDVPQLFSRIWLWWKEKIQSKIKNFAESKRVFKTLMEELYLIVNAKQFQLLKKSPSKSILHNKSLISGRNKMITQVFQNIQNWLTSGAGPIYKRKKNYSYNYGPLQLYQSQMPPEQRIFLQNLAKLSVK